MKASDVVIQLRSIIPQLANDFTTELSVTSLTKAATTITATTTSNHNLIANALVNIAGAETPISITSMSRSQTPKSINRQGQYAILETNKEHKLNDGDVVSVSGANETEFNVTKIRIQKVSEFVIAYFIGAGVADSATGTITMTARDYAYISVVSPHNLTETAKTLDQKVKISGADQADYNGDKPLHGVIDDKDIVIVVENEPPTATGAAFLDEKIPESYNGLHVITSTPALNQFTYEVQKEPISDASGTIVVRFGHRITRVIDISAAQRVYEQQALRDELWMFVVPGGGVISKSRQTDTDATAIIGDGEEYQQLSVFSFSIYVFAKASNGSYAPGAPPNDFLASNIQDYCNNELLASIATSMLGVKFPSPFDEKQFSYCVLAGYDTEGYNNAVYIHRYDMETTQRLNDCDTILAVDNSVRVREIEYRYKSLQQSQDEFAKIDVVKIGASA